ncbi:hypothetical protein [Novosphingobium mangrovi (ex Huang et al. 2023)]|uniref:Uncharacterized protein n=1 Tax=Novosphingobium mangrovi (ex Huang et al. 2023) TaxID=2976432 RepID=A0ABT2I8M2_9SPHN|nr:hypothetical protein [Novosphingobium mangrovi (ex Huang et al. 2023)]MCT2401177.1 hypothetical protein [Novosphingobium mangrovi (ex Huang et al. 2023)]
MKKAITALILAGFALGTASQVSAAFTGHLKIPDIPGESPRATPKDPKAKRDTPQDIVTPAGGAVEHPTVRGTKIKKRGDGEKIGLLVPAVQPAREAARAMPRPK